jgi:hypothetical protein
MERNKDILSQSPQRGTDISGGEGSRLFRLCELCGLERSGREIIKQQEKGISSRRDRRGRRAELIFPVERVPGLAVSVNSVGSSEAGEI